MKRDLEQHNRLTPTPSCPSAQHAAKRKTNFIFISQPLKRTASHSLFTTTPPLLDSFLTVTPQQSCLIVTSFASLVAFSLVVLRLAFLLNAVTLVGSSPGRLFISMCWLT
jgi:hypothetical protein